MLKNNNFLKIGQYIQLCQGTSNRPNLIHVIPLFSLLFLRLPPSILQTRGVKHKARRPIRPTEVLCPAHMITRLSQDHQLLLATEPPRETLAERALLKGQCCETSILMQATLSAYSTASAKAQGGKRWKETSEGRE